MKVSEADILILPGLGNSGRGHWQRRWAERLSSGQFIEQKNWDKPKLEEWVATIERHVMMSTRPVVLVAHSLSVLAVAHAAARMADTKVRGAFLVAAPDPELNSKVARTARAFSPVPRDPLPFPSMLVSSSTDRFCSLERAVDFATCWGSDFHDAGDAGHIDEESGHGPWPEGLLMFTRLMQRLRA
ncbi:alpha/beta hydrolase [Devosia pacifica]|uniref:Alpha/beta hydrolase n=1 Tax=Devosia pacifica TaxID=1335967 RepID=A0A918RX17_9HYPH|nr:alpha/beta hydrolase [Devosia pacifica]GHA14225.1 alpha/beta hydrolase [Devosia pacifica]